MGFSFALRLRSGFFLGLGWFFSISALQAADVTWSSAVSGLWTDTAKWSSGALPTSSDVALINTTADELDYTVTFNSTQTVTGLAMGNASGHLTSLNLTGGTLTLDRGASGVPLTMSNSAVTVASGASLLLRVGDESVSSALTGLTMSGNASVVVNGTLTADKTGGGGTNPRAGVTMAAASGQSNQLTINAGATARLGYNTIGGNGTADTGAVNAVLVDGGTLSMRAITLGQRGENNTITVKNGGTFTGGGSGAGIGGGNGSTLNGTGELIIGGLDADNNMTSGTATISGSLVLGTGLGSGTAKGIVTVKAGTFTLSGTNLTVGGGLSGSATDSKNSGIINVEGGTFALSTGSAHTVTVGAVASSNGEINISGGTANLVRTQGDNVLRLAPNGTALTTGKSTLNLSGGTLNVDKFYSETVGGTINFTGGTFTVKQATIANGKVFTVGDGTHAATLQLVTGTGSGTHTFTDGLAIADLARLEGAGTVSGLVTVDGTIAAGGALSFSSGLTLVDGARLDLNNAAGSLAITGGALSIANGATVGVRLSTFSDGQLVTLFSVAGTTPDLSGVHFKFNDASVTGEWNGALFQITASAIPEPSVYALGLGGVALLVVIGLRRRRTQR